MTFRHVSLRTKLLAIILLTTLVAVVVALGAMVAYDLRVYHQNWVSDIETQAELIGRTVAPALSFDEARAARETLELLRSRPEIRAAAIYRANGKLFASYIAPGQDPALPAEPGSDVAQTDGRLLVLFKQVLENGEVVGTVYLRANYGLLDRVLHYTGIAAVAALAALLIAFLMSSQLQARVTRPILEMAAISRDIVKNQNYSRRARKISDDEIGTLSDSFNDMLAEVEKRTRQTDEANRQLQVEVGERSRNEREIVRLNEVLEDRVRMRTAQLEATNRELAVARKDAEYANHAKSEFLSSMSHELRTPLNAILGFGQILASKNLPVTPEQEKDFAGQIIKAGKHLLSLINEVLDLAKIESGNVSLSMEPVSIAELMIECQMMTEPLARQFDVRMSFPETNDLCVVGDRTRTTQILLNLLSNAIKYNREKGAVSVTCHHTDNGRVCIAVSDTGMGLRAEQLASLFQPFNRLGQEASTVEGTGIGLVVTKKLVEMMGGVLGMSSTVGIGSTFWVELNRAPPIAWPAHLLPAGVKSVDPVTTGDSGAAVDTPNAETIRTVLYVEDNPANLRLVEEVIRFRPGIRLLSAPDARLGISLASAHLPDVILMDINLPGINGIEALRMLHSNQQTAHIPVIAITANAMPHEIAKGIASGFFRYITKPLDLDEFTEALDSALAASIAAAHRTT
ncbi:MAG: ATP-binding protein [Betaproteobacteria bacterium]